MKITEVNTPKAPKAVGPYVQANKVGNLIFCSGQLGINPETGKAWDKAEYAPTINPDALKAKPLTDEEINALEAFLKTLTDEAYEE